MKDPLLELDIIKNAKLKHGNKITLVVFFSLSSCPTCAKFKYGGDWDEICDIVDKKLDISCAVIENDKYIGQAFELLYKKFKCTGKRKALQTVPNIRIYGPFGEMEYSGEISSKKIIDKIIKANES